MMNRRLEDITEAELQGLGAKRKPFRFAYDPLYSLDGDVYFVDRKTKRVWFRSEDYESRSKAYE